MTSKHLLKSRRHSSDTSPRSLADRMLSVMTVTSQRSFRRVSRTEAVLTWGEKVVVGKVIVELLVHSALYNFSYGRYYGDGTIIGRIGSVSALVDGKDGMLPTGASSDKDKLLLTR